MNNLICPRCQQVFDFKNMFAIDDKQIDILGIIYFVKCLNCGSNFVSPCRFQKKLSKIESMKLINEIKSKFQEK
jgi:hypothetical protein